MKTSRRLATMILPALVLSACATPHSTAPMYSQQELPREVQGTWITSEPQPASESNCTNILHHHLDQ